MSTVCYSAEIELDRHTVRRENQNIEADGEDPLWQGNEVHVNRDSEIDVVAEYIFTSKSDSLAQCTVSSSVDMSCNINGGFVGLAQIRGTADTQISNAFSSTTGIDANGKPDYLSISDLNNHRSGGNGQNSGLVTRLPSQRDPSGLNNNKHLLYTGIKRHGVVFKAGINLLVFTLPDTDLRLSFSESAHWTKTKFDADGDGDIDNDDIKNAMFSSYAAAKGIALNNGGQDIGHQIGPASADTTMPEDPDEDDSSDSAQYFAPEQMPPYPLTTPLTAIVARMGVLRVRSLMPVAIIAVHQVIQATMNGAPRRVVMIHTWAICVKSVLLITNGYMRVVHHRMHVMNVTAQTIHCKQVVLKPIRTAIVVLSQVSMRVSRIRISILLRRWCVEIGTVMCS